MELELVYNEETQEWEQKPEPFITIECETEEDFEFIGTAIAFYKKHLEKQEKPQTNADRFRAMSDEELAEDYCKTILKVMQYYGIKNTGIFEDAVRARIEWLKQPAEEGSDNGQA